MQWIQELSWRSCNIKQKQMGRIAKQCVIWGGSNPFTVSEHRIRKEAHRK